MTPDERALISNLFDRLNQVAAQPKDAEAADFIRGKISEQPAAPYLLVQSTLVMQQALAAAQSRIAALEKQLAGSNQEGGGSFLSGVANLLSGGQPSPQPPPLRPLQTPPPLPRQSSFAPPSGAGSGGFLQSALSTAAGVAGGAMLFQGIQNLMGHNPGPFAGLSAPGGGLIGQPTVENNETVNVFEEKPDSEGQPFAKEDSASSLDPNADTDSGTDPALDDSFDSGDGGDFSGDDDSYV
ncbi:MAG TPA: DUF2076 domain-containing protein [Terrimicrobiaceae bacterium]